MQTQNQKSPSVGHRGLWVTLAVLALIAIVLILYFGVYSSGGGGGGGGGY
jgi:hypothetical protein